MCKFTAGKWEAKGFTYDKPYITVKAGDQTICMIGCKGDLKEKEANAVLIAAAPEMYEVLKAFTKVKFASNSEDGKLRKKAYELLNRITRIYSVFYSTEASI